MKLTNALLLDNPKKFFRLRKSYMEIISFMIIALIIFSFLSDVVLRAGLVKNVLPLLPILQTVLINILSGAVFIVVTSVILSVIYRKNIKDMLFVILYSFTPFLLIGWIPFLVLVFITVFWSLFFLLVGMKTRIKMENKKALIAMVLFLIVFGAAFFLYLKFIMPMLYYISF